MIFEKLGVLPAYALNLWMLPVPEAVAAVLKHRQGNADAISLILSKYDKLFLQEVNVACQKNFDVTLQDMIGQTLKGNIKNLCINWINNGNVDKNLEEKLDIFITSRMNIEKVKLKILLRNEDDRQFVVDNLQQQIKIYSEFVPIGERNAEHAKIHSPTKQTMKKSKSAPDRLPAEEEDEFGSDDEEKLKKGSVSLKSGTSEKKSKLINDDIRKIVGKYLKLKFRELDSTKSGFISEDLIPEYIESLELVKMGFTDEEEEGVKDWIGADYDGLLSLDGALAELTDMMMSAIDSQRHASGDNNGLIIQLMTESLTNANGAVSPTKSKINRSNQAKSTDDSTPTIPPDLEKYLRDSFETYDLDKNGVLDEVEFFELITVLNLGLEEADIVELKVIINIELN